MARAARWHGAVQDAHGTWRWLVHEDSGSETEGMTTEVADEHSVYIESLGGRYVWDEDRSCWKWTVYVD